VVGRFHHWLSIIIVLIESYDCNVIIHASSLYTVTGYRRVTAEVDSRNIIGRRFMERCGFYLEGILYKHKVISRRNSDTALYVMLNSDWCDAERALTTLLRVSIGVTALKAADIEVLSATYIATETFSLDEEDKDKHV